MPSLEQLQANISQGKSITRGYTGPTIYRGHQINQKHSMRKVARTVTAFMYRSGFASASVIGHPGSGKSTCVQNLLTDIVEEFGKQGQHCEVFWAGASELRNLHAYFESLPKGENAILVFDDVSKALDKLSGSEQADVFEALTTTRHVLGGKHAIISIYHYSYANLKSVRGQAQVTIYTSASLVEIQNIIQQLGKNGGAAYKLRKFAKLYERAFLHGKFELNISPNVKKEFIMEEPFRPCFVLNMTGAHISLYMKMDNQFGPKSNRRQKIESNVLLDKIDKKYGRDGMSMFRLMCMVKGYPEVYSAKVMYAYKFVQQLEREYHIDYEEISKILRQNTKRLYHKKKEENELRNEILEESKKAIEEEKAKGNLVIEPDERDLL